MLHMHKLFDMHKNVYFYKIKTFFLHRCIKQKFIETDFIWVLNNSEYDIDELGTSQDL